MPQFKSHCFIYRSPKKDEMYLYVVEKDYFNDVPESLLKSFGKPEFAMMLDLDKRDSLARVSIHQVKQGLTDKGFFLQMPPTTEELKIQ